MCDLMSAFAISTLAFAYVHRIVTTPGIISGFDWPFPPERCHLKFMFKRRLWSWWYDPAFTGFPMNVLGLSVLPYDALLYLESLFGLNGEAISKIMLVSVLAFSGVSAYFLLRYLKLSFLARISGAIFYMSLPVMADWLVILGPASIVTTYALFPVAFLFYLKALSSDKNQLKWCILASLASTGVYPIFGIILSSLVFLAHTVWMILVSNRRVEVLKRHLSTLGIIFLIMFATQFWWMQGVLFGHWQQELAGMVQSVGSHPTSFIDSIRLMGHYHPVYEHYIMERKISLLATFAYPVIAFSALLLCRKRREVLFFSILSLPFIVFWGSDWGFTLVKSNFLMLGVFRDMSKVAVIPSLCYTLLSAYVIDELIHKNKTRRHKIVVAVLLIIFIFAYIQPRLRGDLISSPPQNIVWPPGESFATDFIRQQPGNFKVLWVPTGSYSIGGGSGANIWWTSDFYGIYSPQPGLVMGHSQRPVLVPEYWLTNLLFPRKFSPAASQAIPFEPTLAEIAWKWGGSDSDAYTCSTDSIWVGKNRTDDEAWQLWSFGSDVKMLYTTQTGYGEGKGSLAIRHKDSRFGAYANTTIALLEENAELYVIRFYVKPVEWFQGTCIFDLFSKVQIDQGKGPSTINASHWYGPNYPIGWPLISVEFAEDSGMSNSGKLILILRDYNGKLISYTYFNLGATDKDNIFGRWQEITIALSPTKQTVSVAVNGTFRASLTCDVSRLNFNDPGFLYMIGLGDPDIGTQYGGGEVYWSDFVIYAEKGPSLARILGLFNTQYLIYRSNFSSFNWFTTYSSPVWERNSAAEMDYVKNKIMREPELVKVQEVADVAIFLNTKSLPHFFGTTSLGIVGGDLSVIRLLSNPSYNISFDDLVLAFSAQQDNEEVVELADFLMLEEEEDVLDLLMPLITNAQKIEPGIYAKQEMAKEWSDVHLWYWVYENYQESFERIAATSSPQARLSTPFSIVEDGTYFIFSKVYVSRSGSQLDFHLIDASSTSLGRVSIDTFDLDKVGFRWMLISSGNTGVLNSSILDGVSLRAWNLTRGSYTLEIDSFSGENAIASVLIVPSAEFETARLTLQRVMQEKPMISFRSGISDLIASLHEQREALTLHISWQRVNPTKYVVGVEGSSGPFYLTFLERYDEGWEAYIEDESKPVDLHFPVYGYANAWYINKTGDFNLTVTYLPQKMLDVGLRVSFLVYLTCVSYVTYSSLVTFWKRRIKVKVDRVKNGKPPEKMYERKTFS